MKSSSTPKHFWFFFFAIVFNFRLFHEPLWSKYSHTPMHKDRPLFHFEYCFRPSIHLKLNCYKMSSPTQHGNKIFALSSSSSSPQRSGWNCRNFKRDTLPNWDNVTKWNHWIRRNCGLCFLLRHEIIDCQCIGDLGTTNFIQFVATVSVTEFSRLNN